jgi:hypothetical protein
MWDVRRSLLPGDSSLRVRKDGGSSVAQGTKLFVLSVQLTQEMQRQWILQGPGTVVYACNPSYEVAQVGVSWSESVPWQKYEPLPEK